MQKLSKLLLLSALIMITACNETPEFSDKDLPQILTDSEVGNESTEGAAENDTSEETTNTEEESNTPVLEKMRLTRFKLKCSSRRQRKKICKLPKNRRGRILRVKLHTQHSKAECIKGKTFTFKKFSRSLTVRRGCRGTFKIVLVKNLREKIIGTNVFCKYKKNRRLRKKCQRRRKLRLKRTTKLFKLGEFDSKLGIGEVMDFSNATGKMTFHRDGIGIKGGRVASYQINHDPRRKETEAMVFRLPNGVVELTMNLRRLFKDEKGTGERAAYYLLDEDRAVIQKGRLTKRTLEFVGNSKHKGKRTLRTRAKYIVFYALPYKKKDPRRKDSSDFLVHKLKVKYLVD